MTWKASDWCFMEYELKQITRVESGRVTEVKDGCFCMSGYDLTDRCMPMTLHNKNISEEFARWYGKLHTETRSVRLNFPEIHGYFIQRWIETCNMEDDSNIKDSYQELKEFCEDILESVAAATSKKVKGISIFK